MDCVLQQVCSGQNLQCAASEPVQVFYAGLDDLVVGALQVTFGLTDRQSRSTLIPHGTVG